MNYSKNGLHLTENFEGLRLIAYPDPATNGDPWTIGYGHTVAAYLALEDQQVYNNPAAWEEMRLKTADFIEQLEKRYA